uniref:PRA1 family protein n=1 Tax=Scophthalmus maximus TaxID=52904 RepID=A0A8D3B131_SCOMX
MEGVRPPPLRSLDDFLLSSARFALPDVRDLDRWNNRIINNLLYYQSNYLLSALGLLLLVGYFWPLQLCVGAVVVTLLFLGFVWAAENQAPIRRFRRNHPSICVLAILRGQLLFHISAGRRGCLPVWNSLPYTDGSGPCVGELRSLKNKMENKLESIGLRRTPMGLLLEALGQEQEAGS